MSRNYYSEINLHIVWHTKLSIPLLTPAVESETHHHLRYKLINLEGAFVHEIGGTETHVHVAVSIAPTILISDMVGKLKGASSHQINHKLSNGRKLLEWQSGYGVISFGTGDLDWVRDYIRNQKQHHARGKTHDRLERITQPDDAAEEKPASDQAAQAELREAP